MCFQVIITSPPYADFLPEIVTHPLVDGLRLNTIMPLKTSPKDILEKLGSFGKPLWVDLKGRQLRVTDPAQPPFTEIRISHKILVDTPVQAFFSDGTEMCRVMAVDGDRLIMEDGPKRIVGPGESINIPHPSLKILGTLTETDKEYLDAMKILGMQKVMLSYVENPTDIEEVTSYLPNAEILLKVETEKGMAFVRNYGSSYGHIIAARGDLYIEVDRPHKIISALQEIISSDSEAIVASRILESMSFDPVPKCSEISDVSMLLNLGFRRFLLGDSVCFQREALLETLNLLKEIFLDYLHVPH